MGESDPGFGDRLMSGLDLKLEPKPAEGRRIEVITGGRRWRWSDDEIARAVEASLAPGAVVSVVARQLGATPQQLFAWRREARRRAQEGAVYLRADPTEKLEALAAASAPMFKPGRFRAPDKLLAVLNSVSRSKNYVE